MFTAGLNTHTNSVSRAPTAHPSNTAQPHSTHLQLHPAPSTDFQFYYAPLHLLHFYNSDIIVPPRKQAPLPPKPLLSPASRQPCAIRKVAPTPFLKLRVPFFLRTLHQYPHLRLDCLRPLRRSPREGPVPHTSSLHFLADK